MNEKKTPASFEKIKTASLTWPGLFFAALIAAVLIAKPLELQAVPERLTPSGYTLEDFLAEYNEGYEAPEAEVQRKEPAFRSSKKKDENPKKAAAAKGDYDDGVYTGSAAGYGGPVEVQVTVKERQISGVEILSSAGETAEFFNRAMGVIAYVLQRQTWDVDVISGATYSSRGILGAIENALTGKPVENESPPSALPAEPEQAEPYEEPKGYKDGTYTGSARGFGGEITVSVVIKDGKIVSVDILDASGETEPFFTNAKAVIPAILSAQSPNVDTVSGATYSSGGIINAVKRALKQAASGEDAEEPVDPEDPEEPEKPDKPHKPVPEEPDEDDPGRDAVYKDGTYRAAGWCFDEDGIFNYELTVTVKIKKGKIHSVGVARGTDLSDMPEMNERFLSYAVDGRELGGVFYEGVPARIVETQGTYGVDAVSGATYSSYTIKKLVREALKSALSEDAEDPEPEEPEDPGKDDPGKDDPGKDDPGKEDPGKDDPGKDDPGKEDPGKDDPGEDEPGQDDPGETDTVYADGTFPASGWVIDDRYGMFEYEMIVNVSVSEGIITNISVEFGEDRSDDPDDNDYYINYALNGRTKNGNFYPGVPAQVKDKQSVQGVDAVSGATYTSDTLINLISEALKSSASQKEAAK